MESAVTVRPAKPDDAAAMARVIVTSWRETYRGLMDDDVLDDPLLLSRREQFFTVALTDPKYARNSAAVAERDGAIVGVAMAGPPLDDDSPWSVQLYLIYVVEAHHGSGAGAELLDAVIDPAQPVGLWVADPNPRAQAFYRTHGFSADGASRVEEGMRVIRMTRNVA